MSTRTAPSPSRIAPLALLCALWTAPAAEGRTCDGSTRRVAVVGNLSATSALIPDRFDGSSVEQAFNTASYQASVMVIDAHMREQELMFFFVHNAPGSWGLALATFDPLAPGMGAVGSLRLFRFNADGRLTGSRRTVFTVRLDGMKPQRIVVDLSGMRSDLSQTGINSMQVSGCSR